jgi:hypothetical protein
MSPRLMGEEAYRAGQASRLPLRPIEQATFHPEQKRGGRVQNPYAA